METVADKSKKFAVRIIGMADHLRYKRYEYVISKQVLRSGTSIGANIAEAEGCPSKRDFFTKMYIAYKESGETLYWLEVLHDSGKLTAKEFQSMYQDCIEIRKMLGAITKTTRENIERNINKGG